jgi:hypothetical protein
MPASAVCFGRPCTFLQLVPIQQLMQHMTDSVDIPVVVLVERRRRPSRRASWRGGRRNEDWTNRSLDAWRHLEQRASAWRQWVARVAPTGH